ncbi:hypothetical protein AAC387_Pa09g0438 [Persea americana]
MAAAAAGCRSSSLLRYIYKRSFSSPLLIRSQNPRISHLSRIRREPIFLSSLLPIHTATASARLVSKLPREASMLSEGRFANYLSPI